MLKKLIGYFMLVAIFVGVTSACAGDKVQKDNAPQPTAGKESAWRQVEMDLSQQLLGSSDGKCEWEVWGWRQQERYLWVFCQGGPAIDAAAVSLPVVVREAAENSIQILAYPAEGDQFEADVRKLFPPAVQEHILANEFDLAAAMEHLAKRWNYPAMPPTVYARTNDPLPISGDPAVPAVNAANADQVSEYDVLGQGNIQRVQYLPDGQIVISGDRGIGFLDSESGYIDYQFQDLLAGRKGFLSADGKLLAVIEVQEVVVYGTASQTAVIRIDTSEVPGEPYKVAFLADRLTLVVEKHVASEGFPPAYAALFQIDDGALIRSWQFKGNNMEISPNGMTMTGLYDVGGLELWSVPRGELNYTIPVIARDVSFSADGQIMAVAEAVDVELLWVWDGFEIGRLNKNIGTISGTAFSPDGKFILTWSDESYPARLWTVPDFDPVATLDIQGVSTAAFNQDGSSIVLAGDTSIGLYDVKRGKLTQISSDTYASVQELTFAPQRTYSQGQELAVVYRSAPVVIWDIASRSQILVQPDYKATNLVYTNDADEIALITSDDTLVLLNSEDGSLLREYDVFSYTMGGLAVNASGELAVSKRDEIRIYDPANPNANKVRKVFIAGGWIGSLSWPCYLFAATSEGVVQVIDENGEEILQELSSGLEGYDPSLVVLPDCSQLFAAANTQIFRWQMDTWESLEIWTLPAIITSLAISPDASLAAAGLLDGSIQLLDSETGEHLATLPGHRGQVRALAFSPDGQFLASGGTDGVVILWGVK